VLAHLEEAEEALRFAWGEREYARLSANAQHLSDFGIAARMALVRNGFRSRSRAWVSLTGKP